MREVSSACVRELVVGISCIHPLFLLRRSLDSIIVPYTGFIFQTAWDFPALIFSQSTEGDQASSCRMELLYRIHC